MSWALLSSPDSWLALATLSTLETVLGIDNLIFIALLLGKLPPQRQATARLFGLSLAMVTRLALLFSVFAMTRLTRPLFALHGHAFGVRNLVLLAGGLFLMIKGVGEIHHLLEGARTVAQTKAPRPQARWSSVVLQIALIDILFSIDSVFTAVGLARPDQWAIMAAAIVISVLLMMAVAGAIAQFVERHPTIKILALAFLVLIGAALVADGFELAVPKGYLYSAMAFAFAVELLNIRLRNTR